jgi:hypothetical protein
MELFREIRTMNGLLNHTPIPADEPTVEPLLTPDEEKIKENNELVHDIPGFDQEVDPLTLAKGKIPYYIKFLFAIPNAPSVGDMNEYFDDKRKDSRIYSGKERIVEDLNGIHAYLSSVYSISLGYPHEKNPFVWIFR